MLGDTAGGGVTVPEIPPLMSLGGQYFWATLRERILADALTSGSLRSLGATEPGRGMGMGWE